VLFYSLKYLFHNFWVKDFPGMERQNDPSIVLQVDPVASFGAK
jgi:hypothetical protein